MFPFLDAIILASILLFDIVILMFLKRVKKRQLGQECDMTKIG